MPIFLWRSKEVFGLLALWMLLAGCTKEGVSDSIKFTGQGGSLARFTVFGDYLYTVDASKLRSYHIADPANPVPVSSQDVGFEIETIYPFGGRLFIGSTSVIHIFSLDDPARPQRLSTAISPQILRRCDPVVAKDTVAFATLRSNEACGGVRSILAVFDISDITRPVEKAATTLTAPYGLGYADTVLYVCDEPGIWLFNIKDAWKPFVIKTLHDGFFYDVIPLGHLLIAWARHGATIYDIKNPADPIKLSTIDE